VGKKYPAEDLVPGFWLLVSGFSSPVAIATSDLVKVTGDEEPAASTRHQLTEYGDFDIRLF
jgi:hypothetical protein